MMFMIKRTTNFIFSKSRLSQLLLVLLITVSHIGLANRYPEVIYTGSVMPGNYGFSQVAYSGSSWVENVKGRVPLMDSISFTPAHSVSLKYTSSPQGHWEMSLFYPELTSYTLRAEDETLSFRVFLMEGFDDQALPGFNLLQGDTCTSLIELSAFIPQDIHQQWIHVKVPLSAIPELKNDVAVTGITFVQGAATPTGKVNQMLIDQVEFGPANPQNTELSYPAVLTKADAFERHVDLVWQQPLDPGIRYAKIYRSEDKKNFHAIALAPIYASKYTDMVPATDRSYYYKIVWVDYQYTESPFSRILEAKVKQISDVVLLDAIQEANIDFFTGRAEFNSGMHAVSFLETDATVDVGKTGYSLLAHTIGASKGIISNRLFARRLRSMVDFLWEADNYYGAFPSYLDGRTGYTSYDQDSIVKVDLHATASLMQGLIVARNYLKTIRSSNQSAEVDEAIGGRGASRGEDILTLIDQLWKRVEWSRFALQDQTVLYDRWSPQTGFRDAIPLGGFNEDFLTYILALSSPDFSLAPEAYQKGLGIKRILKEPKMSSVHAGLELAGNNYFAVELAESGQTIHELPDYIELPYKSDTTVYGLFLEIGNIDRPLLEAYLPFLAFDPRAKKDQFTNYEVSLRHLGEAYRRRDNEIDAGNASPDVWGTAQTETMHDHLPILVPAISASSYAFSPEIALRAIRKLYTNYGDLLFTEYGFRSWISLHEHKVSESYEALNQAATLVMIENGRTGLVWNLFMQHEDIARTVDQFFVQDTSN